MNFQQIMFCIVLSLFMIFLLNWIYFFNWDGLIDKLVGLIAPKKCLKEIEINRKIREQEVFKSHIKKWKKIFLIHPLTFVVVFFIIAAVTRELLIAYFCGLIVIFILYGVLCNKENHERKKIINVSND